MNMRLLRTQEELEKEGIPLHYLRRYPAGIAVGTYADFVQSTISVVDEAHHGTVIVAYKDNIPHLIGAEVIRRPKRMDQAVVVGGRYPLNIASYAHYGPQRFMQGWEAYKAACRQMPQAIA